MLYEKDSVILNPQQQREKALLRHPQHTKEEKERRWLNFIFSDQIIILSEIILRFQIIHTLYTLHEDLLLGIKHCLLRAFRRVTENIRKTVY